jgi:glycerol kinase
MPNHEYIAAIDQGTTSTRCILFDRAGAVAMAQKEHKQIFPRAGWVEHDALEIWERTQEVIHEVIAKAGARHGEIAAVGVTNQRETTVVWDANTGKPYCNAIVWQDTRTKGICDGLADGSGGVDQFRAVTGLPLATYFSGPKLQWILEHVPGVREAAERGEALAGTIDTWLIWWLTGGPAGGSHVTDVTNASRTMLMRLSTLQWDKGMLETFAVPEQMLPRILPSSVATGYGVTLRGGPFGESIPVCGALGDQQAALVGQTCFEPGESKNTYGTGCFMLLNTGSTAVQSTSGLLTTVGYQLGDAAAVYTLEGSVAIAGALVQWLRDNLGLIKGSGEIEALARSVPDNGGVYFVPAFSGLFAPYWRSDARGTIVGLSGHSDRAHIARAALEATAYQTRDVMEAMERDSGVKLLKLRVDGGMAVNELLMQFQANILGVPVVRPKIIETTALGAAYAAGLAVGYWGSLEELRRQWAEDRCWQPTMVADARSKAMHQWHKAVERAMGWVENFE